MPVTSAASGFTRDYVTMTADVRREAVARMARASAHAAQRKRLARLAAARRAQRQAAQRQAAQQQAAPQPSPSPPATPSGGGGDAASSPLGICIRNAEEGGSYAWGPGNGGGAYQFLLGTWEKYGGAASEYGVAGPAYQDQIFDNAIAAGGASNWTNYDGC
jgi:Transglycosylase-like domain